MMTTEDRETGSLAMVEQALANPQLRDEERAVLLLRVCQLTQFLNPAAFQLYSNKLKALSAKVPADQRAAFEQITAAGAPTPTAQLNKFQQEIMQDIQRAAALAPTDHAGAVALMEACEARLRGHWWPFGKGPLWIRIAQGWTDVDRGHALKLLNRVPEGTQRAILSRLNELDALTSEEWALAQAGVTSKSLLTEMVREILDKDKPVLHLNEALAESVGGTLRAEMFRSDGETQREKSFLRYLKLVTTVQPTAPQEAEALLEALYKTIVETPVLKDTWPDRWTSLRHLINYWADVGLDRETVHTFLAQYTPDYLHDFALAQWFACLVSSEAEGEAAWQSLEAECRDLDKSEAWFLVTLLRRGLGDLALRLARNCPRAGALMPRLYRGWLLLNPETAASVVPLDDIANDVISQFLRRASLAERVAFLRELTDHGRHSLPSAMWQRPDLFQLLKMTSDNALLALYSKAEPLTGQFAAYLRLHAYGEYSREEVDPQLLAALVAWDEEAPQEVESLLRAMWAVMKPETYSGVDVALVQTDVVRNMMFERCQTVFAARPAAFDKLFVQWVKANLVDRPVRRQEGQTVYTFSLKDTVPFVYCLLGAQKVAKVSAKRCDELLRYAITQYTCGDDLMMAAAELYASDKGLAALNPPAPLRNSAQLKAWQLGVIQASLQHIFAASLINVMGTSEPTTETPPQPALEQVPAAALAAPSASAAPAPPTPPVTAPTYATLDGARFRIVTSVAGLCEAIEAEGRGALRLPTLAYGDVLGELIAALRARYGDASRQFRDSVPSPLVCAGCLWEFPGSYKLSLQNAWGTGMVFGATPGYGEFGKTGACPQCGSTESLLVYETFDPASVTQADVDAIRALWRQSAREWWQTQGERQSGICDACSYQEIRRGEGYLSGSSLRCEKCANEALADGVAQLRKDPHYYGAGLLRKVREGRR